MVYRIDTGRIGTINIKHMTTTPVKKVGCNGKCSGGRGYSFFNTTTQMYSQQRSVVVDKLCNSVTVINKGTTIALWNTLPLNPGESMTVGGNEGEVFVGRVDISFQVPVPAPATIINSAWVIQKFYEDKNFVV
jgi:hypothetical protein